MKKTLPFILVLFLSLVCIKPAHADIEAIHMTLEQVGHNHPEFQKKVTEAKAFISKTKNLASHIKETVGEVKKTVKQAEKFANDVVSEAKGAVDKVKGAVDKVKGAVDKAKDIYSKAEGVAQTVKKGQVPTNLSLSEFQSLSFISNGDFSKTDDEKTKATTDLFLKKPEKDDIEFQRQKAKAVNQRNANQSADQYSESLVLRQEIADEADDPQTPETVDEAQSLLQEVSQKSFKRNNQITRMRATQLDHQASNALMRLSLTKKEEGSKDDE